MTCATCRQPIVEGANYHHFGSDGEVVHQDRADCVSAAVRRCAEIADVVAGEYRLFVAVKILTAIRSEFGITEEPKVSK